MVPLARRAHALQFRPQLRPHLDDPAAHLAEVLLPLLEQCRIVEHERGDSGAVGGRVGNFRALEDGQLGRYAGDGIPCRGIGGGNEVECPGPLPVEAEVLGEALRDAQLETLLDEIAHRPRVALQIARGEALVCAVEEREMTSLSYDGGNLLPLVLCGVHACGVVCAGVQKDDGALGSGADGGEHAVEVETLGGGGEVGVGFYGQGDVAEDLVVVGPCGRTEVDGLGLWPGIEFG